MKCCIKCWVTPDSGSESGQAQTCSCSQLLYNERNTLHMYYWILPMICSDMLNITHYMLKYAAYVLLNITHDMLKYATEYAGLLQSSYVTVTRYGILFCPVSTCIGSYKTHAWQWQFWITSSQEPEGYISLCYCDPIWYIILPCILMYRFI